MKKVFLAVLVLLFSFSLFAESYVPPKFSLPKVSLKQEQQQQSDMKDFSNMKIEDDNASNRAIASEYESKEKSRGPSSLPKEDDEQYKGNQWSPSLWLWQKKSR